MKINKKNTCSQLHLQKNIPFMTWLVDIAEEKIIEHRLLKKEFNSHEEFIIFTIIWMRVFKTMLKKLKEDSFSNNLQENILVDKYVKDFYLNQKNEYLGMTINAVTRESEIPRSTVKRNIENLIKKNLVTKNKKNLIIPTYRVRDVMRDYRKYIFKSNKKNYLTFESLNLKNLYDENNIN
jgi:predicted transcriptional regulator